VAARATTAQARHTRAFPGGRKRESASTEGPPSHRILLDSRAQQEENFTSVASPKSSPTFGMQHPLRRLVTHPDLAAELNRKSLARSFAEKGDVEALFLSLFLRERRGHVFSGEGSWPVMHGVNRRDCSCSSGSSCFVSAVTPWRKSRKRTHGRRTFMVTNTCSNRDGWSRVVVRLLEASIHASLNVSCLFRIVVTLFVAFLACSSAGAESYFFHVSKLRIDNTRARHNDTLYVTATASVDGKVIGPVTKDIGDRNNGTHGIDVSVGPIRGERSEREGSAWLSHR